MVREIAIREIDYSPDFVYAKPECGWRTRWAWRRITKIKDGRIFVRYNGIEEFYLYPDEISAFCNVRTKGETK